MSNKAFEEVGLALADGYPSNDREATKKELAKVVALVVPPLAQRASSALGSGRVGVTEVWKYIREDSEKLFAPALTQVERVKVIYVASKFANNKIVGELITR